MRPLGFAVRVVESFVSFLGRNMFARSSSLACAKWVGAFISVFVLSSGVAYAKDSLPAGIVAGPTAEGFAEYRLQNGLKILLYPDQAKPTVTVNITYLVGSRHENYGETGMAHLLEHMLFRGSPKHPHLDQEFNHRGVTSNATTGLDRTNFYEVFPATDDNIKWAFEMEADRMLHSKVARSDLDSEMTVVRNEYEEGENSPMSVLMKRLQNVAYDWHNYGKSTIGNRSDIENVKIENLQTFYHNYYQPDNAVLLVSGKFDSKQVLQWASHAFSSLPKPKRRLPEMWTKEPTQDGERSVIIRRAGDVKIVALAYHIPSSLHADSDALSLAASILSDSPNGRLHKLLVESGQAVQVFSQDVSGYAPGLEIVGAILKKDQAVEPVQAALIDAVEDFSKTAPTADEVERVKRSTGNQIEKMLADPQQIGLAMSDAIALGDWRLLLQGRDDLKKITATQVQAAAAKYFRRDNRTLGLFLPEDKVQRAEIPDAPKLADALKDFMPRKADDSAEAFSPTQENIVQRTHLARIGGLSVALLPKKTRGATVSMVMNLHWGDYKNLFDRKTTAELTAQMLMRGTTKYTRAQLADEFDKLKINGDVYHFETTRENLPAAIRLISHVLREPAFSPEEFEQLRQQALASLEASRHEPQTLVTEAIAQHFNTYPAGDWRAHVPLEQQIEQVKNAKLADIKQFHQDFYGASHGELAIVGDFDEDAAKQAIDEGLGHWASAANYALIRQDYHEVAPTHIVLDTADKENGSYVARMNLDLADTDPDYPALSIADYIFGGGSGLDSRLMTRIRAKDGLSYGGGSSLEAGLTDRAGSFSIGAIAAPQNLTKLELAIQQELVRVLKTGFTAEEVNRAKSGLLQQRQQVRAQDSSLATGWVTYLYLNRSFLWSKQFEDKIRKLTPAEVNAAFKRAIDPAKLSVVMAGDPSKRTK